MQVIEKWSLLARLQFAPHCIFSNSPCIFEKSREFRPETGSQVTGSSASYYVLDVAYIIVFLGSLFSREFAGVTGLVFKAIRGRDGCTRDFGRGRYENLSGAISWLTFFAGGAADERRRPSDCTRRQDGARKFTEH